MTETGHRAGRAGSLTTRIGLGFAGVALLAVVLVVVLVVVTTSRETASLASSQRQQTAATAAAAAASAYRQAGGWTTADLTDAQQIASQAGGRLTVLDTNGQVIASEGMMPGAPGGHGAAMGPATQRGPNAATAPVRVAGRTVGRVVLRVPGSGLSGSEQRLRDRLVTIALVGGGLAVLLALAAALFFARHLTAPLRRLTGAVRALERGEPEARAAVADAPGEIGELGRAFDHMAQTLTDQAEARHALLAEIAHELRTPLTILRGNCEAMVDGVEEATPSRLASLHDEVLRLERLVADLETLSASEAASLTLASAPVDVADVARETVSLLSGQSTNAGILLSTDLTPVVVHGDRARLSQVLENLVTNALKFTPAGGTIAVRVAAGGGAGRGVGAGSGAGSRGVGGAVIEVRDTGRGIPPAELPHVFERYWRGRGSADISGRGLGLAVVDELVRAHGGSIEVASEPGHGSVFTVRIPAP